MEIARLSTTLGADVIISSRSKSNLDAAIASLPEGVAAYAADATIAQEAAQLLQDLAPLDHIVVTASSGMAASSIPDTSPETAQAAFSRFWMSYHVLHFAPNVMHSSGSITLLSGSSGRRPIAGYGVWSSLHGSIESLVRPAALELAPIRVNAISPGGIGLAPDRQLAHHAGQPIDIAKMAIALITNPAVTSTIVDVDSGERLGTWSGEASAMPSR
ncbi:MULTISPECIES: SDR family oxidoreductase [Cyanophyceae]|uniref:SDR family oxidoreductase n=1 Tax=Cyanophyceae TaxID=3028117 RepID=UPI001682137D|nr:MULTISPECIES: SDR family oxidoreductase [Cyanophyceae]MBD1918336.1 SDR family oxidoreductase [Phormidium sp. FACHB-77]MBD2028795.1 SDR family oxidoreductase [Phormidium sp. FACHB-322]MBD2051216.1 SDR family oxidoreductase [Leptolyngbya sp. FACHB-60]